MESRQEMTEMLERVVRTETTLDAHVVEVTQLIADIKSDHRETKERIRALEDSLTRYQGAWGLLSIIGGAIVVAWTIFGQWIKAKLGIGN